MQRIYARAIREFFVITPREISLRAFNPACNFAITPARKETSDQTYCVFGKLRGTSCRTQLNMSFWRKLSSGSHNWKAIIKQKISRSGIEYLGFVRAFECLATAFLLGRTIRFQRASFTETFHSLERKEERTFHGEGSREILAKSFAASFEAAYEIRPTRSLSGPDRSNDLNITKELGRCLQNHPGSPSERSLLPLNC